MYQKSSQPFGSIRNSQAGINAFWAFAKKNALRKRAAIWHETKKRSAKRMKLLISTT